jgi:hypothetical protein
MIAQYLTHFLQEYIDCKEIQWLVQVPLKDEYTHQQLNGIKTCIKMMYAQTFAKIMLPHNKVQIFSFQVTAEEGVTILETSIALPQL